MIKKKSGGILGVIIAFMMVFTAMIPVNMMDAFAAASATCEIKATKVLDGKDLEANQFKFTIEAVTDGAPLPEKTTAENDADGNISFGSATYTSAGTYEYKVKETKGSDSNITYDTAEKTITVTVTESSSGGGTFTPTVHVGEGTAMQWLKDYASNGETVNYEKGSGIYGACTYKVITDGSDQFHPFCLVEEVSSGTDNGQNVKKRYQSNSSNGVGGTLLDSVLQIQNKKKPGVAPGMDKAHVGLQMLFYAGYPYNQANLKGDMSDQEFYRVTQWALWGFMHSLEPGQNTTQRNSSGNTDVYDKLLQYANGGNGTNGLWLPESGVKMFVYWPSGSGDPEDYQPMINAYLSVTPAESTLTAEATTVEFNNSYDNDKIDEPDVTVKIKKTDMGGSELEGAELVVKDSEGTEVESWTSTTDVHELTVTAGTYTLTEVNAPEGYQKVTTEIEFKVDADGKVTVLTTTVEPAGACEVDSDGVLILKDELTSEGGDDEGDGPYLKTEAMNTYISPAENQAITDEVEYGGLTSGKDYVIAGVLKNKDTGETVSAECEPVKISDASESGVEFMEFSKIDASGFSDGDQIVVFEYLYEGTKAGTPGDGTEIVKHADINDEAQTVTVVDGKITLSKTTDVEDAEVGDVVPYDITVSSTRKITSVVNLVDVLGDRLEFVSASDSGELDSEEDNLVYWSSVEVPANGSTTVTIKAKIKDGSGNKVVNNAYVADDYNFENPMGSDEDSAVLGVYESSNSSGSRGSKTKGAKTGDSTKITLFVVALILAAALVTTMIIRRRRSNR